MSASVSAIVNTAGQRPGPAAISSREFSSNNATKHGGTSKKRFVPGEDPATFDALLSGLLEDYRPDTIESNLFVENLADAHWLLSRRLRAHYAIEQAVYRDQPDEANWTEKHLKRLALADRYKTQAERSLKRALNNIDGWRKWIRRDADQEIRHSQWQAMQDVRERRLTLQQQKFALAQSRAAARAAGSAKNALSSPHLVAFDSTYPPAPTNHTASAAATNVNQSLKQVKSA